MALAVVAVRLRLALDASWGHSLPYVALYPAIMASAWLGGLWPGILTTALAGAAADYYWIPPSHSWTVLDRTQLIGWLLFVGIGVFISVLNEAWRRVLVDVAASEERLAVTIESIGDAVLVTDEQGRVLGLNPVAEALTGWRQADAVGRPFQDVLVLVSEETGRPALNPIERALREGAVVGLANHTMLVARDGRVVPIDDSAAPVRNERGHTFGAVMVFRDISARRHLEHERAERERVSRELAAIVQSSDDAIVGMTPDGVVTAWNAAAERMYGYAAREILGTSIRAIIPEDCWSEEQAILDRVRRGEGVERHETIRRRRDGIALPVSLTISPIRDQAGHVVGASKIARDISTRKQIEDERAALLVREQAARRELERASQAKDDFLALLSHELRTPLTAVLGYANLLVAGTVPADAAPQALQAIQRNAQAQARLITSLLDLSRIAAGKLELDREVVDLSSVLRAAIDAIRPEAQARDIGLELDGAQSPASLTGDAGRLQQVFWNLLSNAVKFTPRGGRVSIRSLRCGGIAIVEVTDTGEGISSELLPHVFDRFRQGAGRIQSRTGLGLGLALAREIVQAHGGTIVAESEGERRGSTFRVTLPLTATERPQEASTGAGPKQETTLQGLEVLIVDDDADSREILTLMLESRGARAHGVSSAAEVVRLTRDRQPDVLLADVHMPGEDGYSLIRRIRAAERGQSRLPAIAVTANAGEVDRQRALAAGFDLHVAKPLDAAELIRSIVAITGTDKV